MVKCRNLTQSNFTLTVNFLETSFLANQQEAEQHKLPMNSAQLSSSIEGMNGQSGG